MIRCFYHSADFDGICSAAIVYHNFREQQMDVKLHPINHGEPFPWDEIERTDEVIMVDFALQPADDMRRLAVLCDLTWIDHHVTAIESVPRTLRGIRDTKHAGCELTWTYYRMATMPRVVTLLGRYDVWDHDGEPDAMPFQYGLRMDPDLQDPSSPKWAALLSNDPLVPSIVQTILIRGRTILEYVQEENRKYCSTMFEVEWQGLRFLVANRMMCNSLLFDSRFDVEKHDAMMAFGWRHGGWNFSMYTTKPDVDVSVIAKKMGGGGHRKAAGFKCEDIPFALPRGGTP